MLQTSPLVNKNNIKEKAHDYVHTSMVSHRGTPVSFAMRKDDGKIFYSVLDLSSVKQQVNQISGDDANNDKFFWSNVNFDDDSISCIHFPTELMQVGYAVVPNFTINKYDKDNKKIIHSRDEDGKPLDKENHELTEKAIKDKTDLFYSSTARLGAKMPFQALSDGKYIYVFRQSIKAGDPNNESTAIVDNTLLVDRFILSGTVLKLSREIRYQRSRHKTEPESRKDTLSATDIEGTPFYEPTRELVFANNLANGGFSVLLIPGADSEEQRWQIFTSDASDPVKPKINSFNIKYDPSIVFDMSDSQIIVDRFIKKYQLDDEFISRVQEKLKTPTKDNDQIASDLLKSSLFSAVEEENKESLSDNLSEIIYTIRTGVAKDDFFLESASEWPLIEYEADGNSIKSEYLDGGALKKIYTFQGDKNVLKPHSSPYTPQHGISSCYYYQQEMGPDNKPMKNKASVMLAMGLEDQSQNQNKYIGILNFSVADTGRLSRLTKDAVNMPDINVQALDENPYRDLNSLNSIAWQEPQKMRLLDIDPDGLSSSGGVLKFAYTSADVGKSQGYSDAVLATDPYLFDDSLGRVNLYFKGKSQNFFVLYFNPTGNKSIVITDSNSQIATPPMLLKPRLDRDMDISVISTVPRSKNTCTLSMKSKGEVVEQWKFLPQRLSQVSNILNGAGELPFGTLEPLGNPEDPRAAYKSSIGNTLKIRTTVDNDLMFQVENAFAAELADGHKHTLNPVELSTYLEKNKSLRIAKKSFYLAENESIDLKGDIFYKSYLSGMVNDPGDVEQLWTYLITQKLVQEVSGKPDWGNLKFAAMTGTTASLSALFIDKDIDKLALELLREGNAADKKARRAALKQSLIALILDVAKVRIATFTVQDMNARGIDRLEAGLAVSVLYDYDTHFTCKPNKLDGTSASKWEHARSYLFNANVEYDEVVNPATKISSGFDYFYTINNTIGQWEDWESSLALEFSGAVLTAASEKLTALKPIEKGLSMEAWIKPSRNISSKGNIVCYENRNQHYSLGIEKQEKKYKCVANLGGKKYSCKNSFDFEQWKHLAFSHKKYWGYQLGNQNTINCGNDNSLQLKDEFTLEVLVKIDAKGTLVEKKGEYRLIVNNEKNVEFVSSKENCLLGWVKMNSATIVQQSDINNYKQIEGFWHKKSIPAPLDALGRFYKVTIIRSKNKPQTEPTKAEYPITGGDQAGGPDAKSKWYDGKDSDELLKGMAEKQDHMENSVNLSQENMFGITSGQSTESNSSVSNPKYYHTLIVVYDDNSTKEWTTPVPQTVQSVEAFNNFVLGGNSFEGTFTSVRVWNRALSKSEAKALPVPENKTGLLSHWRMAEGKNKYLYDNVSENHGIANGGTWVDSPQTNRLGQFQFYVDGSPEAHDTADAQSALGVDQLSIGGKKDKNSNFTDRFSGTLEEIRIWIVPRTNEQITDNAFGRLKGEWEQLLANYTFDKPINQTGNKIQDSGVNSLALDIHNENKLEEVLSTAPIATEIPQVRSALTGVLTENNGSVVSRPGVVEYGDVQKNDDGTLNGILKRCYSFIDEDGDWNRMTGYKVGNLISQWYGQAQFSPQVMGFMEGSPPVPAENFPIGKDGDVDTYAYKLNNSVSFNQAEKVSYNYSTSKDAGWNVAVESEGNTGIDISTLIAPLGFGLSFKGKVELAAKSNWETSGKRSESYERGTSVNTARAFSAALAGSDNGESGADRFYKMGNTGYALVKSKTADIYLLRLAHNNALVSITWQPNPDIPEDVNIIPFPINPLYTKQGTLDGKFGETIDNHYPQAHGAYGQYSYFKPREAYQLKKKIEREKMELKAYFEDSFDVSKTNGHFQAASAATGVAQLMTLSPLVGPLLASGFNQVAGQLATQVGYDNSQLKEDLAKMGSQRNLVNTYVWTIEGGFYAESTEVAETQQETYANETSLSLGGGLGAEYGLKAGGSTVQKTMFSSGSSFSLTKTKTREASSSFGLDVSIDIPTSPRYKYAGTDGRALTKGLIKPGVVDAYRFMSFYLEPKGINFIDLFTKVIDPIWLDENPDPNAQALRQARGNQDKAKPCWRIMHRVTYVSRILPEFQPEAPPSLEKSLRVSGIESNYMLIKKLEPHVRNISDSGTFFNKIDEVIENQLPEFKPFKQQIKIYLALYFNIEGA